MNDEVYLTPDLARAARAFTKVSARTIALDAGLTREIVREFEKDRVSLDDSQREALKASLEKYGAHFIAEDSEFGYGVRRRFPREKLLRLNAWEGEGGHV